jgi:hypothetical protein
MWLEACGGSAGKMPEVMCLCGVTLIVVDQLWTPICTTFLSCSVLQGPSFWCWWQRGYKRWIPSPGSSYADRVWTFRIIWLWVASPCWTQWTWISYLFSSCPPSTFASGINNLNPSPLFSYNPHLSLCKNNCTLPCWYILGRISLFWFFRPPEKWATLFRVSFIMMVCLMLRWTAFLLNRISSSWQPLLAILESYHHYWSHMDSWDIQQEMGGLNPISWPRSHRNSKIKPPKVGIVLGWVTFLALNFWCTLPLWSTQP